MDIINVLQIPISARLRNILIRNGIVDLAMVKDYSPKQIIRFRNMGKSTYQELQLICTNYNIYLEWPAREPALYLPYTLHNYRISRSIRQKWAASGISCLTDFSYLSIDFLYQICGNDYSACMKSYYFLKSQNIILNTDKKYFIFEFFDYRICNVLWTHKKVKTILELLQLSSEELNAIRGIGRKSLIKIQYTKKEADNEI